MINWLRTLPPRDHRAFIALWAMIGGTMALTMGIVGVVLILWMGGWSPGTEAIRIDKIGLIAVLVTVIMGVTMTSLGLAINRRSMKGSAFGASFEATGGDEDAPPPAAAGAQAVADSAQTKADQITEETTKGVSP